ncbi:putative selenium-dependent hydroxylase accessory protein YqeC [Photobacterium profundum]|uniref:selenium cofactor biosynthesis protein YqeC n=1 Tax=Photobacterium profundum TaxID=74109 RepID=UPI003D103801
MTPNSLFAQPSPPFVIALVGGGGKTSTAFWLAQEYKKRGHCVFVSTTTKMYLPESHQADCFISRADLFNKDRVLRADKSNNQIDSLPINCSLPLNLESPKNVMETPLLLSRRQPKKSEPSITFCYQEIINETSAADKKKVAGITPEWIDKLKNDSPFTVFIIEADGAKCLPIKAPSGHEPCIPLSSDMVIGVTGAEVIHTQASPERVHRWNVFSALTQCSEGDDMDHRVFSHLIADPQGMFKQAPKHAIKIWLINKVDLACSYSTVKQLAERVITDNQKLDEIWLAAMCDHSPIREIVTR